MRLKDLYSDILIDGEITGIATDSRFVQPGFLFIPLCGSNFTGLEFIQEASLKGAIAVVLSQKYYQATIPVITVSNVDEELKRVLRLFYQNPYLELKLIGVTGTDGKTTTNAIIEHLLQGRYQVAQIGTNGITYRTHHLENLFTTPLLAESLRLLRLFVQNGISHVTMEVSSEGIVSNRIDDFLFDYAVFTNITHEHLNTHHTMDNYFEAKFQLFKQLKINGWAIVNQDDKMASRFTILKNLITYSINNPSDYQAINIKYGKKYLSFDLLTNTKLYRNLRINRLELYNLYNALPAIIVVLKEQIPITTINERLSRIPTVEGRLEKVARTNDVDIYIDFAHTPNALSNVLTELRRITPGKLIIVCGAAGNKDRSKRPIMGKVATNLADYVVFTSEDPKDENANDIIDQMASQVDKHNFSKITNRTDAIRFGIGVSAPGDCLIVTGKGREGTFSSKGKVDSYSDYESIINIIDDDSL